MMVANWEYALFVKENHGSLSLSPHQLPPPQDREARKEKMEKAEHEKQNDRP